MRFISPIIRRLLINFVFCKNITADKDQNRAKLKKRNPRITLQKHLLNTD